MQRYARLINRVFIKRRASQELFRLFFCQEDTPIKELAINGQIREREVRLLDKDGNQLGVMSSYEALRRAEEVNLDLVMISPVARPPVCKIMD